MTSFRVGLAALVLMAGCLVMLAQPREGPPPGLMLQPLVVAPEKPVVAPMVLQSAEARETAAVYGELWAVSQRRPRAMPMVTWAREKRWRSWNRG